MPRTISDLKPDIEAIAGKLTSTEREVIRDAPTFVESATLWKLSGLGLLSRPSRGFVGFTPLGLSIHQLLAADGDQLREDRR